MASNQSQDGFHSLSMSDAAQKLNEDDSIYLLDVRTPQEYHTSHIPQSRNIPLNRISDATEMIPDLQHPIFVYCQSGIRSYSACVKLSEMGYENITDIGAITAWRGGLETDKNE